MKAKSDEKIMKRKDIGRCEDEIYYANEQAYNARYGISLVNLWNKLTNSYRFEAINKYKQISSQITDMPICFEEDAILRIVIGIGNGRSIKGITKNALNTLRAVIYEPDMSFFLACLVNEDLSELINDERVSIIIGTDEHKLEDVLRRNILDINCNHIKVMAQGEYGDSANRYTETLVNNINSIIEEVTLESRIAKTHKVRLCENAIRTVSQLNDNYVIYQLFDKIPTRDIPIIIVSAGPSLMKNCRELQKAKGKALIIAVAHAVKTLVTEDVDPDMIAVSDAAKVDFTNCDTNKENHYLLSSIYASSEIQRDYNTRILYYGFNLERLMFTSTRTDKEPAVELNTGSVATDIFSMFLAAGFRRIILVGQDLAYDKKGYSHSGNEKECSTYEINELFYEVESIDGGVVKTRKDWKEFKEVFERKISEYNNVDVIDATEGGALIHGTKIMTLNDAILEYCIDTYPIAEWLSGFEKGTGEEKKHIEQWFDESIYNAGRILGFLEEITSLSKEITNAWDNGIRTGSDLSIKYKRYDRLYDYLMNSSSGDLVRFYCQAEVHEYLENAMSAEGDDNVEARMILENKLFTSMRDNTENLLILLKEIKG